MSKKWIPTPEIIAKVKELADIGMKEENIARSVGLHPNTFSEKKKHFPELEEAIKEGRSKGERYAAGIIREVMDDPTHKQRLTAAIFYLKTRHHWRELERVGEPDDPQTAPKVEMSNEQLLQSIKKVSSGQTAPDDTHIIVH